MKNLHGNKWIQKAIWYAHELRDDILEKRDILYARFLDVSLWFVNKTIYFWLVFIVFQTNCVRSLQNLRKNLQEKKQKYYRGKNLTSLLMEKEDV